jgi:hypothetical protein
MYPLSHDTVLNIEIFHPFCTSFRKPLIIPIGTRTVRVTPHHYTKSGIFLHDPYILAQDLACFIVKVRAVQREMDRSQSRYLNFGLLDTYPERPRLSCTLTRNGGIVNRQCNRILSRLAV